VAGRAARRRFRKLLSSLTQDLYLAESGSSLHGLVLVTYVREIDGGATALVRELVVSPGGPRGVLAALLDCAEERARRRGAAWIEFSGEGLSNCVEAKTELAGRGYSAGQAPMRREMRQARPIAGVES